MDQFRQDPISGDWVLIATDRAKKPSSEKIKLNSDKASCPFDDPQATGQGEPLLVYSHGKEIEGVEDWTLQVFQNKFPALRQGVCTPAMAHGPIMVAEGNGFHELIVTRDHDRSFAQFTREETSEVIMAYRTRYKIIAQDDCGEYVSIFHNHGRLAGASVYHNHSQILSLPIVPDFIVRGMRNAAALHEKHGMCGHEMLIEWERSEGKRIVFENEHFVALCPFASRNPYQIKIYPKRHSSDFGIISDEEIPFFADAINFCTSKLYKALDNIDYTMFVHTAPVKAPNGEFFHWHLDIMPRLSIEAGFELGTNVFVNPIDPDAAAELLRNTE